eukprot:Gb_29179 [translate_table: standard]
MHVFKVYAWELPGVAGNACNDLTPTVALQLAVVVYGANLFSEPLEDLNVACWFVADGAPPLKCKGDWFCDQRRDNSVSEYLYGVEMQIVGGNLWFRATNGNGIYGGVVAVRDSRRNGPRAMRSCGNGEGSKGQPWVTEAPNDKLIKYLYRIESTPRNQTVIARRRNA